MTTVVYTDGSSNAKTRLGGWGYHFSDGKKRLTGFGGKTDTTNNQMELQAAIEALQRVLKLPEKPSHVVIMTDSQYVQRGITEWIFGWMQNNWKNSQRKEVANRDRWERLFKLVQQHGNVDFQWVKGHAGHAENEYADELAGMGREQAESWTKQDSK